MNKKLRILGFVLSILTVVSIVMWGSRTLMKKESPAEVDDYLAWQPELVKAAQTIPLQDGGRIKPFQTWASTYMLALHGQRSMNILVNGQKIKIKPTEWLLDLAFRSEQADKLPTFRVDNSAILSQLKMPTKELRDRYSFNQLKPYLGALESENNAIRKKQQLEGEDALSLTEKQTSKLYQTILTYHALKNPFKKLAKPSNLVQQMGITHVSEIFNYRDKILGYAKQTASSDLRTLSSISALTALYNTLSREIPYFAEYSTLPLFPPKDSKISGWYSIGKEYAKVAKHNDQAYQQFLQDTNNTLNQAGELDEAKAKELFPAYFKRFTQYIDTDSQRYPDHVQKGIIKLETLHASLNSTDPDTQLNGINAFKKEYASIISNRGEAKHIESEIKLNNRNYFNNSLVLIIIAFLIVTIRCTLLNTKADKILYWLAFAIASVATIYIITGITHRSIIMGRPPIGNLYDTMPFIVAGSLTILLLLELIGKKGILLAIASVLGIGGIVLAKQYEVSQAKDHLDPLVAVLKSNYWLTTHVITIVLGYVGGLVAAVVSMAYVLGRVFGVLDKETRKHLTGVTYGMIAFTLVFSLIGTILGGIWAADSWGRFWGWDPKENGALLIVIWVLIVLHARLGGYIREMGLHCTSVFTAAVVVFSWWHVNFLGVGLHNYGFTSSDAMNALWTFYAMTVAIIILGMVYSFLENVKKQHHKNQIANDRQTDSSPKVEA